MKSLLKRISERRGVCVWISRKRGIGRAGFRQVSTASVSPADTLVSPADTRPRPAERSIQHILLFFNSIYNMAHILLFFWIKGHDKIRPKEICFRYPTWSERRREIRPIDQLLGLGIMLGRLRGLPLRRRRCIMKKLTKRNRTHNRKVVFGYHTECDPGETPDATTKLANGRTTCTTVPGKCCDREL